MKNIIPFKKDVIFKTNLSEITSISLENTLNLKDDTISGDFIISGDYKVSDKSTTVEPFELNIPFEIVLDDRFDTKKATVDIDDFYYEIVNNNVLSVSIDVLVDHLGEKPLVELEDLVDVTPVRTILDSEDDDMEEKNIKKVNSRVFSGSASPSPCKELHDASRFPAGAGPCHNFSGKKKTPRTDFNLSVKDE